MEQNFTWDIVHAKLWKDLSNIRPVLSIILVLLLTIQLMHVVMGV
jgi:hypothetical protein